MLDRKDDAGLIAWRRKSDAHTPLSRLANQLQLTSFAITKSVEEHRAIS